MLGAQRTEGGIIKVLDYKEGSKPEAVVIPKPPPAFKKPTKEYRLMYPEIPVNGPRPSGMYKIELDGEIKDYEMEQGVIIVTDERANDILKSKGFIFMYEKEI